eukprot:scaffold11396_cov66-Phaeocystis_antarctica.AAC.6
MSARTRMRLLDTAAAASGRASRGHALGRWYVGGRLVGGRLRALCKHETRCGVGLSGAEVVSEQEPPQRPTGAAESERAESEVVLSRQSEAPCRGTFGYIRGGGRRRLVPRARAADSRGRFAVTAEEFRKVVLMAPRYVVVVAPGRGRRHYGRLAGLVITYGRHSGWSRGQPQLRRATLTRARVRVLCACACSGAVA